MEFAESVACIGQVFENFGAQNQIHRFIFKRNGFRARVYDARPIGKPTLANPLLRDSQIFRENIDTGDSLCDRNQQIEKIVSAAATDIRRSLNSRLIFQHAPQNNFLRSPSHGLPRRHQPAKSGFQPVRRARSPARMPQCKIILDRLRADRSCVDGPFVFQYVPRAHVHFSAMKYKRLENRLGHARPNHAAGLLAPRNTDRTARGER